ncbi:MAG: hypothetical protein IPP87_15030 [Ideonella sp.]|nr:hypothetical protein [Ideonella sp.]
MSERSAVNSGVGTPPDTHRGRLFRKYLVLIISLVSVALLASGGIGLYFSYQETQAALASLQAEKAVAAAARIEQYMRQVTQQLSFAALPQLDAADTELRRVEFLKLLRQVPEVTDIAWLDAEGKERNAVSRLGMDVTGSGRDRSGEAAFVSARRGQPWYGPVYFRKETEPYHDAGHPLRQRQGPADGGRREPEVHLGRGHAHPDRQARARPMWWTAPACWWPIPTSAWCCARPAWPRWPMCGRPSARTGRCPGDGLARSGGDPGC